MNFNINNSGSQFYNAELSNRENEKSNREKVIKRVVEEVDLNTPDSIGLAIKTLTSEGLEVPEALEELKELHCKHPQNRNESFSKKSNDLKQQVLNELNKMNEE